MKQITYTRSALRTLRRIPVNASQRIRKKIQAYADNPKAQANNVVALKGRDGIRLRVGDWRVIMRDGQVLEVLEIGARGNIYND